MGGQDSGLVVGFCLVRSCLVVFCEDVAIFAGLGLWLVAMGFGFEPFEVYFVLAGAYITALGPLGFHFVG